MKLKRVKYTENYVAFLDILGFRETIRMGTFDEILKIFHVLATDGFVTAFSYITEGDNFYQRYDEFLKK